MCAADVHNNIGTADVQSSTALAPDMTKTRVLFVCLGVQQPFLSPSDLANCCLRCLFVSHISVDSLRSVQETSVAARQLRPFSKRLLIDQVFQMNSSLTHAAQAGGMKTGMTPTNLHCF